MVEGKIDGGAEKITAGKGEVDNGEDRIDEEDGKQDKSRHCERERLPLPEKLLPTPLSWAHNPGFNLLLNLYLHGNLLMKSSSVRTYNGAVGSASLPAACAPNSPTTTNVSHYRFIALNRAAPLSRAFRTLAPPRIIRAHAFCPKATS